MSQKKNKQARRAEKEAAKTLSREEVYKKPPLARLYDRFNPGDYTMRQDLRHTIFLFAFIVIVLALVMVIWIGGSNKYAYERSATLTIPATSFVRGQEDTIYKMLDGYGFKDMQENETGDIVAFGTPDMVQAYQDSYKEKNVANAEKKMREDMTDKGIESISVSDDYKVLTVKTYRDTAQSSASLSQIVQDDDVNDIIQTLYTFCRMRNNGEEMTTRFVNVFDVSDNTEGTEYFTSTRPNGYQMVADIESDELEAAKEEDNTDDTVE